MRWCKKCVYPENAVDFTFNEEGICSGCISKSEIKEINWDQKFSEIKNIFNQYQNKNNYDCIIPVSGGKDSYFQTHFVKKILKLNPLLVTYNSHNFPEIGLKNLKNMREQFDCDHYFFTPGLDTTIKMNRLGFKLTGDPNWHLHAGIGTLPFIVSVKFNIPLILWGEHALDLNGKNFISDQVEWTKRMRDEVCLRNFKIDEFVEDTEKIKIEQLNYLKYPSDEDLKKTGTRGIFLGNYVNWDGNKNYELAKKYGFKIPSEPFQRTYRRISNLDDRYENGVHDLLKYVKFGYGRATDHASRDIRLDKMTRNEGIKMVKKYDHIVSDDLYHWLDYVSMKEEEFWKIADTFRQKNVWKKSKGKWIKENIWDEK